MNSYRFLAILGPHRCRSLEGRYWSVFPGSGCCGKMIHSFKQWVRLIKRDIHAVYFSSRDPRIPWYAKALAIVVAGYALSPIDLIPDFIPVLGYLDDAILLPLGVILVIRLVPPQIMSECRERAAAALEHPVCRNGAIVIGCIWIMCLGLTGLIVRRYYAH